MSIDAGNHTLRCCFFITGSTVYLTGKEEIFDYLGFETGLQIYRVEIVIFDSICRFIYFGLFETFDGMECVELNLQR